MALPHPSYRVQRGPRLKLAPWGARPAGDILEQVFSKHGVKRLQVLISVGGGQGGQICF